MKWEDYAIEFKSDGGLRDIYVLDVSLADWQLLLDFLHSSDYELRYLWGNPEGLPINAAEVFGRKSEDKSLIYVALGSLGLNCHFFDEDEIEFDFGPKEIEGEEQAALVFDFMRQIGLLLNKEVILTPENMRETPIFRFSPVTKEIKYSPVMVDLFGPEFWKRNAIKFP